jgi:putative membrane protein insertion efficiency factor
MKKIILNLIKFYQKTLSPDHGHIFTGSTLRCRFYPSCSQYTYEAIEKYGLILGIFKGVARILRCNPLSKGGFSPIN